MAGTEKVIAAVSKSSVEEVRLSVKVWKGKKYFDIRTYFEPDTGGEKVPTKKGITLSVELWEEFQDALQKLGKALAAEERA